MAESDDRPDDEALVVETISTQLQHFRNCDPPCLGLQLPDGILLRHTRSPSLYFYLRTRVDDGKIKTHVYASDSPYERQKASLGEVGTPMFDREADASHLETLERRLREWVDFVREKPETAREFQGFDLDGG